MHPVEVHVNGLGPLLIQGFVRKSLAVLFSTSIIVGGCGCPISIRVMSSGTASCAFINDSPISASSAYAMIFVVILNIL